MVRSGSWLFCGDGDTVEMLTCTQQPKTGSFGASGCAVQTGMMTTFWENGPKLLPQSILCSANTRPFFTRRVLRNQPVLYNDNSERLDALGGVDLLMRTLTSRIWVTPPHPPPGRTCLKGSRALAMRLCSKVCILDS